MEDENIKLFRYRSSVEQMAGLCSLVDLASIVLGGRDDLKVVEVGVYSGESTRIFLDSDKVSEIVCIDPWTPYYTCGKLHASSKTLSAARSEFERTFGTDERVSAMACTLGEAAPRIPWVPDLIYLDGNLDRRNVADDIDAATRIGCRLISGHDYTRSIAYGGVVDAVKEKLGYPDATFVDTSWIFFGVGN